MVGVPLHTALRQTGDRRSWVTGTVVSFTVTPPRVVVDVDGQGTRLEMPWATVRPVAGRVALVLVSDGRHVMAGMLGEATVTVPGVPVEPPTPPPPTTTTVTLRPHVTGSTRPSASTAPSGDRLVQGDWAGYGVAFGQAVYRTPNLAGVTCVGASVQVRRASGGVYGPQAATLHRMPDDSIVKAPTSQASMALPALAVGQEASVGLPPDWGTALLTGASKALGIYVPSAAPYVVLDGLSSYGPAMTVTLTYTGG